MDKDVFYMMEALKEAKKAFEKDEVPVGALIVYENKIISRTHNQVELLKDATAHAEMLCLSSAYGFLKSWRLSGATMYSTLEPCVMCSGAIILSRLKKVVWGASDVRVGGGGSFIDIFLNHPIHKVEVKGKVLEKESGDLLKKFFSRKRILKKEDSFF